MNTLEIIVNVLAVEVIVGTILFLTVSLAKAYKQIAELKSRG